MKLDYFYIHFEDWVALECELSWPLCSPSLTPCDYFLWGYLINWCCANNPHTIEELKNKFTDNMQVMTIKVSALLQNFTVNFQMVVRE